MTDSDENYIELMNVSSTEVASDLEDEFDDVVDETVLGDSFPLPGDPFTSMVLVYIAARAVEGAASRTGELVAEDIHDYLHSKYDQWSSGDIDDSETISSDDLPHRTSVEVLVVDEEGKVINRYYGPERKGETEDE